MDVHDGYFDHISTILNARQHPTIVLEKAAMRWMGAAESSSDVSDSVPLTRTQAYCDRT